MGKRSFIEMAWQGRNEWWRYVATLFLVFLGWQFIGVIPLFVFSYLKAGDAQEWIEAAENAFLGLGIDSNLYLLLIIFSFIGGLAFLVLGVRTIHHRSMKSLTSSRPKVDWNRILFGFVFWFLVSVLLIALDYMAHPEDFTNNFKWIPFLILALVSFVFIPFQTSFEELLFRGYLMQGVGLLFRNAWAPLLLTSVGFGLLHAFNPEVEKLGPMITGTAGFTVESAGDGARVAWLEDVDVPRLPGFLAPVAARIGAIGFRLAMRRLARQLRAQPPRGSVVSAVR